MLSGIMLRIDLYTLPLSTKDAYDHLFAAWQFAVAAGKTSMMSAEETRRYLSKNYGDLYDEPSKGEHVTLSNGCTLERYQFESSRLQKIILRFVVPGVGDRSLLYAYWDRETGFRWVELRTGMPIE